MLRNNKKENPEVMKFREKLTLLNIEPSIRHLVISKKKMVHQYGRRKSTKTSGVHFFYKSYFFSLEK